MASKKRPDLVLLTALCGGMAVLVLCALYLSSYGGAPLSRSLPAASLCSVFGVGCSGSVPPYSCSASLSPASISAPGQGTVLTYSGSQSAPLFIWDVARSQWLENFGPPSGGTCTYYDSASGTYYNDYCHGDAGTPTIYPQVTGQLNLCAYYGATGECSNGCAVTATVGGCSDPLPAASGNSSGYQLPPSSTKKYAGSYCFLNTTGNTFYFGGSGSDYSSFVSAAANLGVIVSPR